MKLIKRNKDLDKTYLPDLFSFWKDFGYSSPKFYLPLMPRLNYPPTEFNEMDKVMFEDWTIDWFFVVF